MGVAFSLLLGFAQGVCRGEDRFVTFGRLPSELPPAVPIELSVEDAVLRALEVNYDVTIQRLARRIREAGVLRERGAFEPEFYVEGGRTSATDTNATEETDSGEVGLRTRWITGTELSFSTDYSETGGETGGSARAVVSLTQPLLKDGGLAVPRSGLIIARRNRDISVQDLKRQMIDTATGVLQMYWDLVAARERLAVQEESLRHATDLAGLTRQRAEAGLMGESDIVEAQAAVSTRESDVVRAAETVRSLEDGLKEDLTLLENPAYWDAPLVPTTPVTMPSADVAFLGALAEAFRSRPDYDAELLRLKNADLSLYVARRQLLPRLDLTAQAERSADVDGAGSALDAASDEDEEVWSVFLSLAIPLGNKGARADSRAAKAEREQEFLRLKQLELRVIREVRRAVDAVNTSRKVVETTAQAVDLERRKLENERTKLDLGKSTTDNVVRFIQSLNSARLSHVQAVIDYSKALARLEQVQGTTLNRYGVTVE